MKKIVLMVILIMAIGAISYSHAEDCRSDFNCRFGYLCVKPPFKSEGVCMKAVDEHKRPTYPKKDLDSIGPKLEGDCKFNTDCPIGFKCDRKYKVCVSK